MIRVYWNRNGANVSSRLRMDWMSILNKYHFLVAIVIVFIISACTVGGDQNNGPAVLPADRAQAMKTAPAETAAAPAETAEPAAAAPVGETPAAADLPILGPAPAWRNEVWINNEGPLPLEDLRGKVVLLEFWTFG